MFSLDLAIRMRNQLFDHNNFVSRDCFVALPRGAMGLSAVCDCGISWSYSLTILTNSDSPSIENPNKFLNLISMNFPLLCEFVLRYAKHFSVDETLSIWHFTCPSVCLLSVGSVQR